MTRSARQSVGEKRRKGIGKLVEFGADAEAAVAVLAPLARQARHPQTQQYGGERSEVNRNA